MKKNTDIYDRFVQTARRVPSDERVPFGFERRIMAHLHDQPALDPLSFWVLGLWRAAVPCLAVMLLITAWSSLIVSSSASAQSESIGTELQLTMTQPLLALEETW